MNPANPVDDPIEESTSQSTESSFGDILRQFEQEQAAAPAAKAAEASSAGKGPIKGKVLAITEDSVFVDIKGKSDGVLPKSALSAEMSEIAVGDLVEVTITGRNEEGQALLSPLKVEKPKDWSGLLAAFEEKRNVAGKVTETVKGGVRVDIGGRAFMPASRSGTRDAFELQKLVGQDVEVRILSIDVEKEDIVVDRRVVLEEESAKKKESRFQALKEGDVVKGRVRSVTDFGAFLDLDGVDGLLHVADMSWHRVGKPADVVSIGDELEVKILKLNANTRKVSLGLKQMQPDPWTVASQQFQPGQKVIGSVARLTDFGAFVELSPGVDGLVHLSQMSWSKKVRKPSDLLKVGDQVEVVVLGVKPGDKRIELSLKSALGDPFVEALEKYKVNTIVEAPVTSIQAFGAFVDLGDGIDGMIHIGDMANDRRIDHPRDVVKEGEVVRAIVLDIDKDRRRIRLGLKQLQPTKVDNFIAEHQVGETISGLISDVRGNHLRIEVAEGVLADCRLEDPKKEEAKPAEASAGSADVGSLAAMLKGRWKEGKGGDPAPKANNLRPGMVRTVKITGLDAEHKKITVELIG
ncbi:MAG TPA: S1 RNA-binding domain-containing protein [Bryobacteraceae bacterium]|nr:S1 RNA-binding domain-containing protein [Bryobacteraceae bacterium]